MKKTRYQLAASSRPLTIGFLAVPNIQILDVAGPYQIFVRAAEIYQATHPGKPSPYKMLLIGGKGDAIVPTNCGLGLAHAIDYRDVTEPLDTLLIAGGRGTEKAAADKGLLQWIRLTAGKARRYGSICTGTFLLGAARLLEGRRVTTHWKWADQLANLHPRACVDPDPIFIRDDRLYTSAGVTAGMDLALALVEEDLGSHVALEVARELVMYLRRAGGQSQFSAALTLQASDRHEIADIQRWAVEHVGDDLRVITLAERARMSPRNFSRIFTQATGDTPASFVERIRMEAARRRLEESTDKLEKVSVDCGFGNADGLRRTFLRVLKISPSEYRDRFHSNAPSLQRFRLESRRPRTLAR